MPLIRTISPEAATGELVELYSRILAITGRVPNSFQIWSISPELYKQQQSFIDYYITHKTLSTALLACIRMLISSATECQYCIDFNKAILLNVCGWQIEEIEDVAVLAETHQSPRLSEKENKLLTFVLKSVKYCKKADVADLDALRALGWDDADILDAVQHGARMAAIDVILNTFDVENDNLL